MENWQDYAELDKSSGKILYKGFDIGLTIELIHDFQANTGLSIDFEMVESIYNSNIIIIRDKKINEILGTT